MNTGTPIFKINKNLHSMFHELCQLEMLNFVNFKNGGTCVPRPTLDVMLSVL